MVSMMPTTDLERCRFLELPLELRQRIYRILVSPKYAKTPKEVDEGLHSSTRYNWNLDPVIFRVNRQIYEEAKDVMAVENSFVVIEWPQDLLPKADDMIEDDAGIMIYNVTLWPGKRTKNVNVPGEKMRVRFAKREKGSAARLDSLVLLSDELRDFCAALCTFRNKDGTYRTAGLCAYVYLPQLQNLEISEADEDLLLGPLRKFRYLESAAIEGKSSKENKRLLGVMKRGKFDEESVLSTVDELVISGDEARDRDLYDVATVYYQRAHDHFHHFAQHDQLERHVFGQNPGKVPATEFKIMQHRALNWILDGDFDQAFAVSNIALECAQMFFMAGAPPNFGPPTNRRGEVSKGALRKWKCQCVKEGAERTGQLIKAEDIGRCYYYRSISGHVVGGDRATEQADDDKMTGIGCCVMSDTMGDENVPKELLELDIRAMENLKTGPCDEHGDDEWEDED